jgi:homoserine O-succinyltransferase
MPVFLQGDPSGHELSRRTNGQLGKLSARFHESDANCIDIGLLNNMPDAALHSTERQFLRLIDSAAPKLLVRLSLYTLPDIPRTNAGQCHVNSFYSTMESLWNSHLDGLIITGTEPKASKLIDEPYWGSLIRVLEWAEQNTHSTILSCLSAHAAVLHLDGIHRQRLSAKRFGLFESNLVADHPLTAYTPSRSQMPHSRWNDIPENELSGCGYRVLARAPDASVDIFVKQRKSLFVFIQGHPEYETNTLLLEYRRDIGRYLRQETETYPSIPNGYLDADTAGLLSTLRERALHDRREALVADFPITLLETGIVNSWRSTAARICGNWLTHLSTRKESRVSPIYSWNSA